jgi:DivIVA domain
MERFSRTLRGYDPEEVSKFLDGVIVKVESMVEEIHSKDESIKRLLPLREENIKLRDKLEQYRNTEDTMNKAIFMAQKTSDQMRLNAHNEREVILREAKNNANRIINEALLKAEKAQSDTDKLKRNIVVFKKRIKDIIETQLEVVEQIEVLDLNGN